MTTATGRRRTAVAILVAAFALRAIVGLAVNVEEDGRLRGFHIYRAMARNIVDGEGAYFHFYFGLGDRWANRPPGYPLMLAGLRAVFGTAEWPILVVQSALGALTVLGMMAIARRFGGDRAALLAGVVGALYPYSIANDTSLVEQPLYVALATAFAALALRARDRLGTAAGPPWRSAVALGALAGLTSLTRETFNVFLPLFCLWVLFGWPRPAFRRRVAWCALFTMTFLVVCSPWLVRNQRRFGVPAFSFAAGKSLWVGNNEHTFEHYPERSIDDSEKAAWEAILRERPELAREILDLRHDERLQDAKFGELGAAYVREDPVRFVVAGLAKIAALFAPWLVPRSDFLKELGYSLSYGPVLILALLAPFVLDRRWRPLLVFTALGLASVSVVAFAFWGQTRLRASFDGLLIVIAVGVVTRWWAARAARSSG